ncbi:MAG: hypothetical protein HN488_08320 [Saprospiraceae bacterium]|jgi:hypothetical protein|nr:hypothetical protein [Saprospiraceae bacterium]
MKVVWTLLLCIVLFSSCNNKINSLRISDLAQSYEHISHFDVPEGYSSTCREPINYAPDLDYPLEYYKQEVRINVHYMDAEKGKYNFDRSEGELYFDQIMENAIMRLEINEKMRLPEGNETPVLAANFTYVLRDMDTEVGRSPYAFHKDDDLYWFLSKGKNRNNSRKEVLTKYQQDEGSVLNIFIQPTHPDSVASKTYTTDITGIAMGTNVKIAGVYELGLPAWQHATNLNHEIAHILGLSHSWYRNDGCDDTPPNSNCWNSSGKPPCEGPTSNNMMDYNSSQMALTPCQIGKIHRNFHKQDSKQRKLLVPRWCESDDFQSIVIDQDRKWLGSKDLKNDVIVKSGNTLEIYCRVSMAEGRKITVEPGATLKLYNAHLHNDCGDTWEGIDLQSTKRKNGKIEMHGKCSIENVIK